MARYLERTCPKCAGPLDVVMLSPERKSTTQAINGLCASCGYRLRWQLIRGGYRRQESAFWPRVPKRFYDD